jgi:Flp pilus assembly pilin Flp
MGRKVRREMTAILGMRLARVLARLGHEEEGQALTEYALLVALIALVAFGAVNEFGLGVSKLFSKVVANYP